MEEEHACAVSANVINEAIPRTLFRADIVSAIIFRANVKMVVCVVAKIKVPVYVARVNANQDGQVGVAHAVHRKTIAFPDLVNSSVPVMEIVSVVNANAKKPPLVATLENSVNVDHFTARFKNMKFKYLLPLFFFSFKNPELSFPFRSAKINF